MRVSAAPDDLDEVVTAAVGAADLVAAGGGTSTPAASVAMQNASASASARIAATTVASTVIPRVLGRRCQEVGLVAADARLVTLVFAVPLASVVPAPPPRSASSSSPRSSWRQPAQTWCAPCSLGAKLTLHRRHSAVWVFRSEQCGVRDRE